MAVRPPQVNHEVPVDILKGPITLSLISALVAAPLFAETITLKNGQTYVGEVVETTSEYIQLKTDSGVLRIEMSTIARLTTSHVEAEDAAPVDTSKVVADAQAAAEAEVNMSLWFATGCLLNVFGIISAFSVRPSPPESHLIGKSPEYVEAFTEAYLQKAKSIQREGAIAGCLAGTLLSCGIIILVLKAAADKAAEDMKEDLDPGGCAAPQGMQPSGP